MSRVDTCCSRNLSQAHFSTLNLAISANTSELPDNFHNLSNSGGTKWVSFCQEPTAGVNWYSPTEIHSAFINQAATFTRLAKFQLFIVNKLGGSKGIV
jgi:hypothetical protein